MKKDNSIKIVIVLVVISLLGTGLALYNTFNNKVTYKDIDVRTTDSYIQYKYKDSDEWADLVKIETLVGKSGREVEIKKDGNFVKWRYTDEENWTNLIDLTSLIGQDGKNGVSGKDGREIEVSTSDDYIVYRYKGDKSWTKLIGLSSLKGKDGTDGNNGTDGVNGTDGKEVEITKDDTYVKWRYKGEEVWNNLIDLVSLKGQDGSNGSNGTVGVNGKEIELDNDGINVKWRYVGTETWNTLTSIADLKGEKGDKGDSGQDGSDGLDGREIELENDGVNIKWRYKDSDEEYTNLISVDTLKGKDGLAWINLGVVDTTPYCKTYNEGEEDEYEDCGYYEYVKQHFPEAEEGNYIFTDNEDSFIWHVKVEKAENENGEFALISYWSTEETYPYFIRALKFTGDEQWETYDISYADWDSVNYYVNELRDRINGIDYQNLGTKDVFTDCDIDNEYCPISYIKRELVEKKLKNGKYVFTDNDDGFMWYVRVEIANQANGNKIANVTYWSTENTNTYVLYGDYDGTAKVWKWIEEPKMIMTDNDLNNLYNRISTMSSDISSLKNSNNSLNSSLKSLKVYVDNNTAFRSKLSCQRASFKSVDESIEDYLISVGYQYKFPEHISQAGCLLIVDVDTEKVYRVSLLYMGSYYSDSLGTETFMAKYIEYYEISKPEVVRYNVIYQRYENNDEFEFQGWKTKNDTSGLENSIEELKTRLEKLERKDLGLINTNDYCKVYNEGTANERTNCGYDEYLRQVFPNLEEGNYRFTDNDDGFVYNVSVEKNEYNGYQYALIMYWSTEDSFPYYIQAYAPVGETEWQTSEIVFATYQELDRRYKELTNKNQALESRIKALEEAIDEIKNQNP